MAARAPKTALAEAKPKTIYQRLGVPQRINAAGTLTRLGGSLMAPEVLLAMAQAAEALRARVPEGYEGQLRALHLPAAALPAGGQGLQAALVADTQQLVHDALTALLQARPRADRQLQLHVNASRESALFTRELPRGPSKVPDDEWMEMCARLLGLPSPACKPIVGQPLRAVGRRACAFVDPYGDELAAAITFAEGHFAKFQHDPVLYALYDYARTYGSTFAKLEDADFFGSVLRNGPVARSPDALARKRVLTPDLRVHLNQAMWLVEMKTVHYGPSRYTRWPADFNHAVERRAALVPVERLKDIIDTDRTVFNTPQGVEGPLQQRLRTASKGFTGIATGAFGEWSQSLVDLIKIFAEMGASKWMDRLGAPSPEQARSTLMRLMRGQLGMRVARGHARLIIERARAVGGGSAEARGFARGPAGAGARYAQDAWHHQQHQRGSGGKHWGRRQGCGRGRGAPGARGGAGWR